MFDAKTQQIAAELIAKFDEAMKAENFAEMTRIVDIVCASPNRPFKREVLRQIGY